MLDWVIHETYSSDPNHLDHRRDICDGRKFRNYWDCSRCRAAYGYFSVIVFKDMFFARIDFPMRSRDQYIVWCHVVAVWIFQRWDNIAIVRFMGDLVPFVGEGPRLAIDDA